VGGEVVEGGGRGRMCVLTLCCVLV